MEIRRDITIGPGLIAIACIALAFVTIGLFVRMTPAVRDVLKENVESQAAAILIMEVVAERWGGGLDEPQQLRLRAALKQAAENVTIPGEEEIVEMLETAAMTAIVGDEYAFERLLVNARRLWEINMSVMREAGRDATHLGVAGSWTAVFGGIFIVLFTIVTVSRLRRRIAVPFEDIARVMAGQRNGAVHLRCRPLPGAIELERLREQLNEVLDQRDVQRLAVGPDVSQVFVLRVALVATLEQFSEAVVVLSRDGDILAGNETGLEIMATALGAAIRREARELIEGRDDYAEVALSAGDASVKLTCKSLEAGHAALVFLSDFKAGSSFLDFADAATGGAADAATGEAADAATDEAADAAIDEAADTDEAADSVADASSTSDAAPEDAASSSEDLANDEPT